MYIIIGMLFIIFMFLVDWRLNGIHKELKTLNQAIKQKGDQAAGVDVSHEGHNE